MNTLLRPALFALPALVSIACAESFPTAAVAGGSPFGCTADAEADIAAISATAAEYETALNREHGTWIRFFSGDAVVHPPAGPAAIGTANIERWGHALPTFRAFWLEPSNMALAGDAAVVLGRYSIVLNLPGDPDHPEAGLYRQEWRRQSDGSWKLSLLRFASESGPATALVGNLAAANVGSHVAMAEVSTERDRAPVKSGTIVSGLFKLRYIIEGSGPPAIVVGSALYHQRVFSPSLRQHLRLVFVDHRGYAPSPGKVDLSEFALETLLDDIEKTRTQLDLGRVIIIGHSGHAFMALEYAKAYPQSVSHAVMIAIGPDNSEASRAAAGRAWAESAAPERKAALEKKRRAITDGELARQSPGRRQIRLWVRNGPKHWFDPQFDSTPLWEGIELNGQMFSHVWGKIFRDIDITEGLDTFAVPVFLALGRYDFAVPPPTAWDPLRPKFRDLTVRVFERSGHTPQYEEPELFDAELLRWLREKTPATTAARGQ